MSTASDIPPNIAQLTGPLLLGVLFTWGLLGALIVQAYIYYTAFPRDRLSLKILVWVTFVLEVIGACLVTRDAFRVFGTGFGNMEPLDTVGWLWFSGPILNSIISCSAQLFYAWRISVLSGNIYTSVPIVLLAALQGGTGFYSGWFVLHVGVWSEISRAYRTTCVWLGGTALCDLIIAISMMYYLNKSRTGFAGTSSVLSKFVRLTIETGAICATFAILDLAMFLAFQTTNYHLAPNLPLSKLYSNSLLAVFNARAKITSSRSTTESDDRMTSPSYNIQTTSGMSFGRNIQKAQLTSTDPAKDGPAINVQITKTREDDSMGGFDDMDTKDAIALKTPDEFKYASFDAEHRNNIHHSVA